jgi:M6 family metalloprotease-like protein
MNRAKTGLALLISTMLVSTTLMVAPLSAAIKPGTKCTKAGATVVVSGKQFTCVKSGKRLVWNKGVAVKAAQKPAASSEQLPAPTATPSAPEPQSPSAEPTPETQQTQTESAWKDPREGTPCDTEGAIIPNQIWELRCLMPSKVMPGSTDNRLIWVQNYLSQSLPVVAKAPAPSKPVAYKDPTVASVNIDQCKIREVSSVRTVLASGFPVIAPPTARTGTVKWALIPVDFSDIPGDANFRSRIDGQMKMLTEYVSMMSEGNLKVEWVVHPTWIRMPGLSTQYNLPTSDDPDRSADIDKFYKDLMRETDKFVDFKGIQVANFIAPLAQTFLREGVQGFPWTKNVQNVKTNEGVVPAFSFPGKFHDAPARAYWSYWAHEYGHTVGIGHVGSSREENAYSGYDLMGIQDGPSREISGWLRFIMGWMPDNKVHCSDLATLQSVDVTLAPINDSKSGMKMSVVRLASNRALIIESRRVTKFTCNMPTPLNGVMAYIYDARFGHYEPFLIPVIPSGRVAERSDCMTISTPNPLLREGEKVTVEGVTIEVLDLGTYDRVRISRARG